MKQAFILALSGGFLFACGNPPPPKSTTVEFSQSQPVEPDRDPIGESTVDQELGDGIRVEFINANGTHAEKQERVRQQMERFINSGQHEIVRVSTTRCNRSEAHLLSAEIYYRAKN